MESILLSIFANSMAKILTMKIMMMMMDKARIFLLVDLQEFFFRFRVGGTKKIK